jgi:beta-lactamase regulating signal transducer with metallopeptidase domain
MAPEIELVERIAAGVVEAMVNGVVQGVLITLAVGSVLHRIRTSAAVRHSVWMWTLVVVGLLPVVSAAGALGEIGAGSAGAGGDVGVAVIAPGSGLAPGVGGETGVAAGGGPISSRSGGETDALSAGGAIGSRSGGGTAALSPSGPIDSRSRGGVAPEPASAAAPAGVADHTSDFMPGTGGWPAELPAIPLPDGWALLAVVSILFLVSGFRVLTVVVGIRRIRRLKRLARPLPPEVRELLEPLRDRRSWPALRLALSGEIRVPLAAGFLRPMVLLPDSLLTDLDPEELGQVTLHELAHIRRGDHWANLVQRLLAAVYFYHPAVIWIGRRLELEREIACDDFVLARRPGDIAYARCLTRLAEIAIGSRRDRMAPANAPGTGQLRRRVESLLSSRTVRHEHVPTFAASAALITIGGLGLGLASGTPRITVRQPDVTEHRVLLPPSVAVAGNPVAAPLSPATDLSASPERPASPIGSSGDVAFAPTGGTLATTAEPGTLAAAPTPIPAPATATAPAGRDGRPDDGSRRSPRPDIPPRVPDQLDAGSGPAAGGAQAHLPVDPIVVAASVATSGNGCEAEMPCEDVTPATGDERLALELAGDPDATESAHGGSDEPTATEDTGDARPDDSGQRIPITIRIPGLGEPRRAPRPTPPATFPPRPLPGDPVRPTPSAGLGGGPPRPIR